MILCTYIRRPGRPARTTARPAGTIGGAVRKGGRRRGKRRFFCLETGIRCRRDGVVPAPFGIDGGEAAVPVVGRFSEADGL
ncbi:MAG: hypothetical protein HSCHL_0381 [Hydrogenibacillus schlegelii]|uniref:Uncharacterized protein n=1 Tax=Hydrogenibacillus schlegelii TaxID=1484 RepID=A0A2T5GE49_HYDSH|nr:MAG: hypothetical protein HSCHL_0381 [Hydrogenibacillus schlegelii]